jgi:hypothetical protein
MELGLPVKAGHDDAFAERQKLRINDKADLLREVGRSSVHRSQADFAPSLGDPCRSASPPN